MEAAGHALCEGGRVNDTILLCTLTAEIALAVGYALAWWERFIGEGRAMVMGMLQAVMPRSLP
jgi:hypothetical protein